MPIYYYLIFSCFQRLDVRLWWRGLALQRMDAHPLFSTNYLFDMVLGFKTHIKGKPTHFVQKILACNPGGYADAFKPKKHSIRGGERWKPGMKIHMAIGVRTKDYFQFNGDGIGLDKVISTQKIEIKYENSNSDFPTVIIDGRRFNIFVNADVPVLERLALNDGFESFGNFLDWFSSDFSGQIIHWTDERY